jgi:mannose-6-phosphate isomerase-like protein (cupin superfamily)
MGGAAINREEKLSKLSEHWSLKIVGGYNGNDLIVAKVQGEFVWHSHPDTDDFFMVLNGCLTIQMRDRNVVLNPGEIFVVPKGVEHGPRADQECHVLVIEPRGTANTGDEATATQKLMI